MVHLLRMVDRRKHAFPLPPYLPLHNVITLIVNRPRCWLAWVIWLIHHVHLLIRVINCSIIKLVGVTYLSSLAFSSVLKHRTETLRKLGMLFNQINEGRGTLISGWSFLSETEAAALYLVWWGSSRFVKFLKNGREERSEFMWDSIMRNFLALKFVFKKLFSNESQGLLKIINGKVTITEFKSFWSFLKGPELIVFSENFFESVQGNSILKGKWWEKEYRMDSKLFTKLKEFKSGEELWFIWVSIKEKLKFVFDWIFF